MAQFNHEKVIEMAQMLAKVCIGRHVDATLHFFPVDTISILRRLVLVPEMTGKEA